MNTPDNVDGVDKTKCRRVRTVLGVLHKPNPWQATGLPSWLVVGVWIPAIPAYPRNIQFNGIDRARVADNNMKDSDDAGILVWVFVGIIIMRKLHCPQAGPGPVGPARPYEGQGRARVLASWPGPHRVKGQGSGLGPTLARPDPV